MASEQPLPSIALRVMDPQTLEDVEKWAALARVIGCPDNAPVTVHSIQGNWMEVRAWLRGLQFPADADLDDNADEVSDA